MKIFKLDNFNKFCSYVNTEKQILDLLERDASEISDDFILIYLPLAELINSYGVNYVNNIINSNNLNFKNLKRVFICQHILVDHLLFLESDIVFSPHSSYKNNFISIPHYSINFDKPIKDKIDNFSFIGSTQTHWTRKEIVKLYDNCYDSGFHWGLSSDVSISFKKKYIDHTNRFRYSLCPRGTGISSIRLFESMAMNCTPIILADNYRLPLEDLINWKDFIIKIPEKEVFNIKNYIIPKKPIINIYNKYFKNDNLHYTIKIELNK